MKIKLKNLGVIKQAEFELGDLTIICGGNNTGKTYATYALFGFLDKCHDILKVNIKNDIVNTLVNEGAVSIDLVDYIAEARNILQKGCEEYSRYLPEIFSANEKLFANTEFQISIDNHKLNSNDSFKRVAGSQNKDIFSFDQEENSTNLIVSLLEEKGNIEFPNSVIKKIISDTIIVILFDKLLPNPFISSVERTGAAIFMNELDFSRNKLLKDMYNLDKDKDPRSLLFKNYQQYALPVESNVEFIRSLKKATNNTSFIYKKHPDILNEFSNMIGGEYEINQNTLYFKPRNTNIKLPMNESSSAVRSLLDIGFYIRHIAKIGDILIVDEPELNLHPENQRRVARLLARLVNIGIKVFITTHSDYIIKEFNTLIMLNSDKPHIKKIAKEEGYNKNEFITAKQVKVYVAEESLIKLDERTRRSKCQTLMQADINDELGIEVKSFDTAINNMNRIHESILWGEE